MKLTNKHYDILKWIVSVFLPALLLFLSVVFRETGWEYSELFMTIAIAFEVFLGSLLKVSDTNYNKQGE